MSKSLKYIIYLFCLCGAFAFSACTSNEKTDDTDPLWPEGYDPEVILAFKVSIDNTAASPLSRADDQQSPFPATDGQASNYELIHTLRVIIVRPDNTIERIRKVDMTEPVNFVNELEFKVSTSQGVTEDLGYASEYARTEIKRIYLIANEDAIRPISTLNAFKDLKEGDEFTKETAASLLISNNWISESNPNNSFAVPILDNEGQNPGYVPMTEFFDIPVRANLMYPELTREQNEHLFITRNYVKFQFHVEGNSGSAFKISKVRFENLMQKEYLFPNEVVYDPPKYDNDNHVNTIPHGAKREIQAYKTPGQDDNNLIRPYEFTPANFGFDGVNATPQFDQFYRPLLYFCESENYSNDWATKSFFRVGIEITFFNEDNTTEILTFEPKELNNLAYSLPRNSIVQVNMKILNRELLCSVTLVPYIGVELDPGFGFEVLRPKKN